VTSAARCDMSATAMATDFGLNDDNVTDSTDGAAAQYSRQRSSVYSRLIHWKHADDMHLAVPNIHDAENATTNGENSAV